jgi:FixJ family two-component response regulator
MIDGVDGVDGRATGSRPPTIAVIDDDTQLQAAVARVLQSGHSCAVRAFASVEEFLASLDSDSQAHFDLILLDFHLPGQDGPKLIAELQSRRSFLLDHSYIMGMTGDPERLVQSAFQDAGIEEIIQKPLRRTDFAKISKVATAVSKRMADIAYTNAPKGEGTPNAIKKYL